ncbi:MAG: aminotransferase class III-fold pyridoxal phosphate-dependent enzyme [Spirochaetales bacterium]|nr:aminotransferase class III-fold pyridoxal phosphate-dependent enzyme [Spirochaetales bacterium]
MATREEIKKNNLDYTIFSWSTQGGLSPIVVDRGEGIYFWDKDGKRYIDFSSQLMNNNIGHGNQKITAAVVKQMEQVAFVYPGIATQARGELGRKLAEITPGDLTKTFFTLGGAEAIDNAVKLARAYTGRHKIIARYRAYHGASIGAMTVGGDPRKLAHDSQQMPNVVHVEDPFCYRCPFGQKIESCQRECVEHIERVIQFEGPGNVAAILMEGVSGSSGCITYPPDYWQKLRQIADKYGILIIADEVMSGFGRTGKWFGIDHSGVVPDIMVLAKGLTSGYLPLGGIIVTDKIASYYNDKPFQQGLTYSAHAVACAAAVAVISEYESQNLIENAARMGDYMRRKAEEMKGRHPSIGDYRNTGLLGCFELVKNRQTKEPMAPFNATAPQMAVMNQVAAKLRELGMFTFVRWNYIFTAPPLIIDEAGMDEGLAIISEALKIADQHCN